MQAEISQMEISKPGKIKAKPSAWLDTTKGAFTSNLFGLVRANSGAFVHSIWFGPFGLAKEQSMTEQPNQDHLKMRISVLFQSGLVQLWCESKADQPQDCVIVDT